MENYKLSRRDFLKGTAIGAAAMAVLGHETLLTPLLAQDTIAAKNTETPEEIGNSGIIRWTQLTPLEHDSWNGIKPENLAGETQYALLTQPKISPDGTINGLVAVEENSAFAHALLENNGQQLKLAGFLEQSVTVARGPSLLHIYKELQDINGEDTAQIILFGKEDGIDIHAAAAIRTLKPSHINIQVNGGPEQRWSFATGTYMVADPNTGNFYFLEPSLPTSQIVIQPTSENFSNDLKGFGINAPVNSLIMYERDINTGVIISVVTDRGRYNFADVIPSLDHNNVTLEAPNGSNIKQNDGSYSVTNDHLIESSSAFAALDTQYKLFRGYGGYWKINAPEGQTPGDWYVVTNPDGDIRFVHSDKVTFGSEAIVANAPVTQEPFEPTPSRAPQPEEQPIPVGEIVPFVDETWHGVRANVPSRDGTKAKEIKFITNISNITTLGITSMSSFQEVIGDLGVPTNTPDGNLLSNGDSFFLADSSSQFQVIDNSQHLAFEGDVMYNLGDGKLVFTVDKDTGITRLYFDVRTQLTQNSDPEVINNGLERMLGYMINISAIHYARTNGSKIQFKPETFDQTDIQNLISNTFQINFSA